MLVKNTYINILSNGVAALTGFVGTILVVRVYGAVVVGKIAYMTGLVGLMTFVVDLGIDRAGLKYIAEKKDDFTEEFAAYLFIKMILLMVFLCVAAVFLLFVFKVEDRFLYLLVAGNIFWATLADVFKSSLTARRAFFQLAVQSGVARVVMLLFTVMFCTVWTNWYYVALLPSIENFCLVLIAIPYFVSRMKIARLEIHFPVWKRYVTYALPLSISTGISLSIANLDKVFVGNLLSNAHVGYLAVAEKVFSVFDLLIKALTQQLLPEISYLLANVKEKVFRIQMEKIVFMSNLMATSMALFLIAYADIMIEILYGKGFGASALILRTFSLLVLVKLFFRPYHSVIFATEKQGLFLWFTVPTFAINVLLTYLLIPLNIRGVLIGGAARPLSNTLAWLAPRGVGVLYVVRKTFGTLFMARLKGVYALFVLLSVAAVAASEVFTGTVSTILVQTGVLAVFASVLWGGGVIDKDMKAELLAPVKGLCSSLAGGGRRGSEPAEDLDEFVGGG